jgi:NTP pyrophosphatase (non-canonical NTP hydrolase)
MKKKAKQNDLSFAELRVFIAEFDRFFRRKYRSSNKERTLALSVKLAEETGEFCAVVLSALGQQRADKLKKFKVAHVADEAADVIITLFVLTEILGADISAGLRRKMKKIERRIATW